MSSLMVSVVEAVKGPRPRGHHFCPHSQRAFGLESINDPSDVYLGGIKFQLCLFHGGRTTGWCPFS